MTCRTVLEWLALHFAVGRMGRLDEETNAVGRSSRSQVSSQRWPCADTCSRVVAGFVGCRWSRFEWSRFVVDRGDRGTTVHIEIPRIQPGFGKNGEQPGSNLQPTWKSAVKSGFWLLAVGLIGLFPDGVCAESTRISLSSQPSGSVRSPIRLQGRIRPDSTDGFWVQTHMERIFVRCSGGRFDVPLFVRPNGQPHIDVMVGVGLDDPIELTVSLDMVDPSFIDSEMAKLDGSLTGVISLAQRLFDAGLPNPAQVVLTLPRQQAASLEEKARAWLLGCQIEVMSAVDRPCGALPELPDLSSLDGRLRRRLARELGEGLFLAGRLALVHGRPRALAEKIYAAGNALFAQANLLPRRLLKGY